MLIVWIFLWLVAGLVIGALGRLAVPGPNPMSIGATILVGLGGSIVGGIVGAILFGPRRSGGFLLAVLGAALIVWLVQRRPIRR